MKSSFRSWSKMCSSRHNRDRPALTGVKLARRSFLADPPEDSPRSLRAESLCVPVTSQVWQTSAQCQMSSAGGW